MEEIKVGEYVISQNRLVIGKILEIENDDKILIKTRKVEAYIGKWNIKKHSFDIKDLIEPKDYINGIRVINVDSDKNIYVAEDLGHPHITGESNGCFDYSVINFDWFDIKSIVTKEQFESMSYKVGD